MKTAIETFLDLQAAFGKRFYELTEREYVTLALAVEKGETTAETAAKNFKKERVI